ncbi:MAG: zf-HC2 domain-containing protein [Elusimicrobiota bacterium]
MSCEKYAEAVSSYVDGELEPGERLDLATHLARCSGCMADLVETERAKALVSAETPRKMPEALRSRIGSMIDEESAAVEPLWRRLWSPIPRHPRWALAGAAAAAAALAIGLGSLRTEKPTTVPLDRLLAEHVRSSRKSVDIHRGILAAAPYDVMRQYRDE